MENGDRQTHLQQATREVFEPRAGRERSDEDVREITHNLSGFFRLLCEWAREVEEGGETPKPTDSMSAQKSPKEPGKEK